MTYTHTRGPWHIRIIKGQRFIVGPDSGTVAMIPQLNRFPKQADANARMLAAAPSLLDALQFILPLAEAYLASAPTHPDNAKLESARDAIREATKP